MALTTGYLSTCATMYPVGRRKGFRPPFQHELARLGGRRFQHLLSVEVESCDSGWTKRAKGLLARRFFDAEEDCGGEVRPGDEPHLIEASHANQGKIVEVCILSAASFPVAPGIYEVLRSAVRARSDGRRARERVSAGPSRTCGRVFRGASRRNVSAFRRRVRVFFDQWTLVSVPPAAVARHPAFHDNG